jgi:regulator of sirC expression with transglutaminase-like and TPR domain
MSRLLSLTALCLLCPTLQSAAPPPASAPAGKVLTVEQLARSARPSLAVITVKTRDGKRSGVGTGFVVSADGLIATNFHVIGQGRAITVEMADGKRLEVLAVHASDRQLDLAVLRVKARGLTPLPLGDSGRLRDGQAVVALGNPQGLKHSVVAGVVSGQRRIDGRPMIQVAIPIEPGNSGGPLLDRSGRVLGIMTIKSLVTANLGFAVGVNSLQPLLRKPNPVSISAWMTIGRLDPDEWLVKGSGSWRRRAGRIMAEGPGGGFGGRSLCLAQRAVPPLPFEVAVAVRLDEETGAAGLVFHADGGDKHYGFYPSNGQLRLTRFSGPDVFSWKVLQQKSSAAYRPGEWNTLKVRLDRERIRCFVNDQLVFDVRDDAFASGKVGLAKFRDTVAEFKQFRVGKTIPADTPPPALAAAIDKALKDLPPAGPIQADMVRKWTPGRPATLAALRERARLLEQQAAQLRQLALAVHQQTVLADLVRILKGKEEDIDLLHGALLIARLDNDEVDIAAYRGEVERMARKIASSLPRGATEKMKRAALNRFLFTEKGFHGSRSDYYNRSNSYLSEVIDDREGLPITLSVLYIELARRLAMKVEGVGLPGHFVVRHVPKEGTPELIDVYEGGQPLSKAEAARKVKAITGREMGDESLKAVPKRAILVRMLHNLLNVARGERDGPSMLRYLDTIIVLDPGAGSERVLRAGLRYQVGDHKGALDDVEWLLKHEPEGIDLEQVRRMRGFLMREER